VSIAAAVTIIASTVAVAVLAAESGQSGGQ
jgi:hypothetical protein